ncbi:MAG: XkdX family protein [Clostridia bacterium]|nr:XkdX family protein [Clostridia bacterium]
MSNVEKIRRYYMLGIYTERHLAALLAAGAITEEEYDEITREG